MNIYLIKKIGRPCLPLCLLLFLLAHFTGAIAQGNDQKITKAHLVLDAQNNKSGTGFVDLRSATAHNFMQAAMGQGDIDIVYAHGKTTGINLMTPASSGLRYFGAFKSTIHENWKVKNKGTLIALGNAKEIRKAFKKLKTSEDIKNAYDRAARTVMLREDYSKGRHGPSSRIQRLEIGDYFVFRSKGRKIYAMGRVVNRQSGFSGSVSIDWKIATAP